MGSLSPELPPCSSATANPHCMLLAPYGGGEEEACNITGDTETIAAAATSSGHRIIVSIRREPSPVLSRICLRFLPGRADRQSAYSTVIAAHGGSVLVQITSTDGYLKPTHCDYFVYSHAGAAGDPTRSPSLYLLPRWRWMDVSATGLVCHGEAEFVVAELVKIAGPNDDAAAASLTSFELHLFWHGEWCVKRPRIIGNHHDLRLWEPQAVVHLGDGVLCWVDLWYRCLRGVIVSNVLDESPELRYVPYPAEVVGSYRCFLCTNARGVLKLVRLSPGRCSHCGCSEHATAVNTWALKMDDMAWVLETETTVDSTDELWALETRACGGYARVHLVYPVVSMNMNGGSRHVVLDESSAPTTEEEVEHTAGEGGSHKENY